MILQSYRVYYNISRIIHNKCKTSHLYDILVVVSVAMTSVIDKCM